ncbi:DUF2490 domain-containing protein [Polymorphobacter fuscus]|uniref:DUF2490 domain-containing protein n=1 Tax=Sandarakinorhabdus fusca TaxID=1439888 RepID=A0A7C9GQE5_9SPHN|nr:DUF2490 domain-containing protein [Polymorphobacter fuscus]KAB7644967.1 DUF2490 domain-containing protein [Polymorphobacter fuscus]MQT18255.1 DUF2490 domain-containing protein [Polymorphobacter fuscus]NJC09579.1 hypothetical protein [Polymorphobacter fuscus]
MTDLRGARRHLAAVLAPVLALAPAAARADDTQLWATAILQGPIEPGKGVKPMVWIEVQPRLANDVSQLNPMIARTGFGVRIGPDFNALFGYHFQRNAPRGGRVTSEHRMWQQLLLPIYRDPDRLIVTTRLRLEQRTIESAQDLGWRARALVRVQAPLKGEGSAGPLLWSEALVGLNDTDWGQQSGVRQIRAFVGALVPVHPRLNFEGGYMAQIERNRGDHRVNHVANLTLNWRLGD